MKINSLFRSLRARMRPLGTETREKLDQLLQLSARHHVGNSTVSASMESFGLHRRSSGMADMLQNIRDVAEEKSLMHLTRVVVFQWRLAPLLNKVRVL